MLVCPYCAHQNPAGQNTCSNCGAGLTGAPFQALGVGSTLQGGKYVIEQPLAQGGFGITYLASHVALGQKVIIKENCPQGAMRLGTTLHPPTTQAGGWRQTVTNFVQEARTLATFHHSAIVTVQDVFEENNTAYFVMENLQGQTLAAKIQNSILSEDQAVTLARQLGGALREVHSKGLLHRDIKPDNVFLEQQRGGVLIDFGSARGFTGQTVQHTQMLSPGYAPLEQYSATARFGPYTDIYALGATLYTALTGQLPPDAYARANGTPLQFKAHISSDWRNLIDSCMKFKVDERPQTIDAFLARVPGASTTAVMPLAINNPTTPIPPVNVPFTVALPSMPTPPKRGSLSGLWFLALPVLAVAGWFAYTNFKPNQAQNTSSSANTLHISQVEIAAAFLNVRTQPSPDAPKLQISGSNVQVVRGERLIVSGERSGWYNVSVQGETGFINSKFAIPLEPEVSSDALKQLENAAQNGTALTLEPGVYRLPDGLNLVDGVQLEGSVLGKTILLSEAQSSTLSGNGGTIGLKNLTIAHVGSAPTAVAIFRNNHLILENVRVMGGQDNTDPTGDEGDGLVLYDSDGGITSSFFLGNVWRGMSIHGRSNVTVTESKFTANSGSGIAVTDNSQPILRHNEMTGNGLVGIKIFDQATPVLETNLISENTRGGISFFGFATASLSNNRCENNGQFSVSLETKQKLNLAGNPGCMVTLPVVLKSQSTKVLKVQFVENSSTPGVSFAVPASRAALLAMAINKNLWYTRLARNRSLNFSVEVGAIQHEARASAGDVYSWGIRWCNSTLALLASDLEKLNLRIEAGGIPVSSTAVYQGLEPTASGGKQYCYRIATLIRAQAGASAHLSVIGDVLSGDVISDDKRPFEPGEHRIDLDVTFY